MVGGFSSWALPFLAAFFKQGGSVSGQQQKSYETKVKVFFLLALLLSDNFANEGVRRGPL